MSEGNNDDGAHANIGSRPEMRITFKDDHSSSSNLVLHIFRNTPTVNSGTIVPFYGCLFLIPYKNKTDGNICIIIS